MLIRDRIREFRRVKAGLLRPSSKNWRAHPSRQRDAMLGMLAEIGYADALLVRPLDDGTLELIDGHLRAELTPEMEVPVLVLDVTAAEADKLLALHDPLAAMAETNFAALSDLVAQVDTENAAVQRLLDKLAEPTRGDLQRDAPEIDIPEVFQLVIECRDEADQRTLYERLSAEGYACKPLNL
ncbi:MAG TPA: hypothetical protein VG433_03570 [Pirellulales bacterium]|jgi:hypothetical protein|nr:hypothetical protein [Pirellulales bacterium]